MKANKLCKFEKSFHFVNYSSSDGKVYQVIEVECKYINLSFDSSFMTIILLSLIIETIQLRMHVMFEIVAVHIECLLSKKLCSFSCILNLPIGSPTWLNIVFHIEQIANTSNFAWPSTISAATLGSQLLTAREFPTLAIIRFD